MSTALSTLLQIAVLIILATAILIVYCRTSAKRRNDADKDNANLNTMKDDISSIKQHLGIAEDANRENRPKAGNN